MLNVMPTQPRRGFTLIELMVTIAIIAIIASVGMVTYSQTQKLARDAKRKQDLRSLSVAMEIYYQKFGHYPCTAAATWLSSGTTQSNWITNHAATCATGTALDTQYINRVPIDPSSQSTATNPQAGNATLGYGYTSSVLSVGSCSKAAGQYFILVAGLENASDPEARVNKVSYYCDGTTVMPLGASSPNYGNNKFIVTSW